MRDGGGEQWMPRRKANVYTVELDGEAVLLDEAADRLHLLNHTGTLLWLLFDGHASLGDLADELAAELGADRSTVLDDILVIAGQLAEEGLLT